MVTTRSLAAAGPHALFEALLSGNAAKAHRLLQGRTAGQPSHTGPCGITTLHAALVGGCADALPALVAAGAPLDAALEDDSWSGPLRDFMDGIAKVDGVKHNYTTMGSTALTVAAMCAAWIEERVCLACGAILQHAMLGLAGAHTDPLLINHLPVQDGRQAGGAGAAGAGR